jgi:DNA-binding CsgD family transcriptional regulator
VTAAADTPTDAAQWTRCDRAVLPLVARGFTNAEIGRRLGCHTDTIKRRVWAAKNRAGARDRAHLAALWTWSQQQPEQLTASLNAVQRQVEHARQILNAYRPDLSPPERRYVIDQIRSVLNPPEQRTQP